MPVHKYETAIANNAGKDISSDKWNAEHVPIKSAANATTEGGAIVLTDTVGASAQVILVEKVEVTCDGDNDADYCTIGAGSAGQVIDVVVVSVGASTSNTFRITGTFSGGATAVYIPATGTGLIGRGVRLIWSVSDTAWTIDCFYNEWPARGIECFEPVAAEPTAITGIMQMYAKLVAGRVVPKVMGPSGVDSPIQMAIWQNKVLCWSPGTAALPCYMGMAPTLAATCSHPAPATTNAGTWLSRAQFATSTTAGNAAGLRGIAAWAIGSAAIKGGFHFVCRFNQGSLHTTGVTKAVGMTSSTAALTNTGPSAGMADFIGLCLDPTDTIWQFSRRTASGTATKVSTTITAAADVVIEMIMFVPPAGTYLYIRVQTIALTGVTTTVLDTSYNTVLPGATTMLAPHFQVCNGTLAAAHNIGLNKLYLESDY